MRVILNHSRWTRERMPQISDVSAFLAWSGIAHRSEVVSPRHLKPIQSEVNLDLVFGLIQAGLNTAKYPVLISADNRIIDGHNRWYAAYVQRSDMHVIRLSMSGHSLLQVALQYPDTQHTDINHTDEVKS